MQRLRCGPINVLNLAINMTDHWYTHHPDAWRQGPFDNFVRNTGTRLKINEPCTVYNIIDANQP